MSETGNSANIWSRILTGIGVGAVFIGKYVGVAAILFGFFGQYILSNKLDDISVESTKTSNLILDRLELMIKNERWTDIRLTIRDSISNLKGYKIDTLAPAAENRGLAHDSCLSMEPKGELLLTELKIDTRIDKIKVTKKDPSLNYVLITLLSTDFIQKSLYEYSIKHEEDADNFTPDDIKAVLGAVMAYYYKYCQT